jgi:hypothetical protein
MCAHASQTGSKWCWYGEYGNGKEEDDLTEVGRGTRVESDYDRQDDV